MKLTVYSTTIVFLIHILLNEQVLAQKRVCDCTIHGIVKDKVSQKSLKDATIFLEGTDSGTSTEQTGFYQITHLCAGKYVLVCQLVGYQTIRKTINLTGNTHQEDLLVEEKNERLQEVVVVGTKQETLTQAKNSIDGNALEQTRGQSLAEALKTVTGVTSLQTGSSISKPVIHGLHSNRVLLLNNGIRQEGQQWGAEHAPEIDPFIATKLSVIKGAAGVRYGADAIGGVVLVEPSPLSDSTHWQGEVNLVGFSNGRQGVVSTIWQGGFHALKGFAFRVQGTLKKGADTQTPNYILQNTGIEEQNFSLTGRYKHTQWGTEWYFSQFNTKIGTFTGSHIGNIDDLTLTLSRNRPLAIYTPNNPSYTIDRPYQDLQHNLLKIKSFLHINSLGKLSWTLSSQYNYRAEIDVLRGTKDLVQYFQLNTYQSEILLEHHPWIAHTSGMIGINTVLQENLSSGLTVSQPSARTVLIPNYDNFSTGLFCIENYRKGNFEIEGGLRFDTRQLIVYQKAPAPATEILRSSLTNSNFSGTIGMVYTTKNLITRLNYATAWRPPQVNELFSQGVHHGAAAYEVGNANALPETAHNLSLTLEYQSTKFSAEATFYRNNIKGYIYLQPQDSLVYTIRGAFPLFAYKQTDAEFQGIDFSFNWLIYKNLHLISKFSLIRAKDLWRDVFLYGIPSDRSEIQLQYNWQKPHISLTVNYLGVSQQTRFEPNIDFALPPPAYSLWGVQGQWQASKRWSLGLTITNLLNISYREYMNRFRYFTDDIGRNISLRLKLIL